MRPSYLFLSALMALILSSPIQAQTQPQPQVQPEAQPQVQPQVQEPEKESVQLYDVELILFERVSEGAGSTEEWPDDPDMPDYTNAFVIQEAEKTDEESIIQRLPEASHLLSAEARQIKRRRGKLQTLLHIAWRQPGLERNEAIPVYLRSAETTESNIPRLEGTVTITRQRYLHANFDLLLNKSPYNYQGDASYFNQTTGFRYQGHRKMRSGELHYMDHPLMGALIKIEKYTPPEPEPEPEPEPVLPVEIESVETASPAPPPVQGPATEATPSQ